METKKKKHIKEKIEMFDYFKFLNFCYSKDAINKVKRQSQAQNNVFSMDITDNILNILRIQMSVRKTT